MLLNSLRNYDVISIIKYLRNPLLWFKMAAAAILNILVVINWFTMLLKVRF